jgi:hypothetical protein
MKRKLKMPPHLRSLSRGDQASFHIALLVIIGCGVALSACAAGSGVDSRQAYRDAGARCVGAPDEIVCRDEQQRQIINEKYAAICRAKGVTDNSPAMTSCKNELGYADCVRSASDYQGYIGQMSRRATWQPSPSTLCRKYYPAD